MTDKEKKQMVDEAYSVESISKGPLSVFGRVPQNAAVVKVVAAEKSKSKDDAKDNSAKK